MLNKIALRNARRLWKDYLNYFLTLCVITALMFSFHSLLFSKDIYEMIHYGNNGVLNGEWIIVSAGGKSIETIDEMPYLTFEKSTGKFYASNGCNVLNGTFTLDDGFFESVLSYLQAFTSNSHAFL